MCKLLQKLHHFIVLQVKTLRPQTRDKTESIVKFAFPISLPVYS